MRVLVALLVAATAALAGCNDSAPATPIPGFPGADGWASDTVPPLFVGEAWNVTFGWGGGAQDGYAAPEVGYFWSMDDLSGIGAAADLPADRTAFAADTVERRFNVTVTAPGAGHWLLHGYIVYGDEARASVATDVHVMDRGTIHTISIGDIPLGPLSMWSQSSLRIRQGDAVVWVNNDALAPHDATSLDQTGLNAFATGTLAPGASSDPVWFRATGTVTYYCSLHPDTMPSADIVVT